MDIKKELTENQTVLLTTPSSDYNKVVVDIVKELAEKSVCYVTLNKTFSGLKEAFQKNGVNVENIVFIDAISSTLKATPEETEGCYFVSSPAALTELSLTISKILKHDFDYLVFDSLTNLLIYKEKEPVVKFVFTLINRIRETKIRAVFYALSVEEQEALIEESSAFVDKVIDVGGAEK